MCEKRIKDHVEKLMKEATRALNRGDREALRVIHNDLLQLGDAERAAVVESHIRKLSNTWATVN